MPTRAVRLIFSAFLSASLVGPLAFAQSGAPILPSGHTDAEDAAAAMGRQMSNEEIYDAIRKSGLSEDQIRARLQAAGYDPSLADPFFANGNVMRRGQSSRSTEFAQALRDIGLMGGTQAAGEDADRAVGDLDAAPVGLPDSSGDSGRSRVFGRNVFRRGTSAFDPVTSGPVDPGYRLGSGDELQLVLTGGVEQAYRLIISREGTVIIPDVGTVPLAGLTLEAARTLLRERASRVYSGLQNGRVQLDLAVSRVRTNAVFVIGEVQSPGMYQVNALSTVFHALARAGGPTDRGSFRNVELRRAGTTVRHIDLYRYLLDGDASDDIRTEQGDIIFVPLAERSVGIDGAVRRPATFELRDGEGLTDLLRFAGGLEPTAVTNRVQVDRILPASQRRPGIDRVLIDVEANASTDSLPNVKLFDGDVVRAFQIGKLRRNSVSIAGQVFQPGTYELMPKMTLGGLLERAQGMLPWATADRVKITRTIRGTGRSESFSLDAQSDAGKGFVLQEFDSVMVLDGRLAYPSGIVSVSGAVNKPADLPFLENETVADALDRAGGVREDAAYVEVSERRTSEDYSDTTSIVRRFELDSARRLSPEAAQIRLHRDARIFVRSAPGFRKQRFVRLAGMFRYPGTYAINAGVDRVDDLVRRAGGTLPGAYSQRFRLVRAARPVAIDFHEALSGNQEQNILLEDGDELSIGPNPGTVYVGGDVQRASLVVYQPGMSVDDYIERAGGARPDGDASAAMVEGPNGMTRRVRQHLHFFKSEPDVVAGSVITVPLKPDNKDGAKEFVTTAFQLTSTIISLAIAWMAVRR